MKTLAKTVKVNCFRALLQILQQSKDIIQDKWLNLGKYNKSCSVCNLPYSYSPSPSFLVALETTAAQLVNTSSLASIREQRIGLEFLQSPISS